MVYDIQPLAFADAERQRQYEAVLAALASPNGPAMVLLGNPAALGGPPADALLVRPDGLVLLVLTPAAGQLRVPATPGEQWALNGRPLPPRADGANPLAAYAAQLPDALAWLAGQLGQPPEQLPPARGLAVFDAPLTFGPEVEGHLHQLAEDYDFELVGGVAQLPARLGRLPAAPPLLPEAELLAWAGTLAALVAADPPPTGPLPGDEQSPADYLLHKLRQVP